MFSGATERCGSALREGLGTDSGSVETMIGQSPGPRACTCWCAPRKTIRSIVAGNRFQPAGIVGP